MKDGSESRPGDLVLTRWSILIRDWLGSDTLRGMSGDGEMLFVRLCLDQMEKGVARADKSLWKRAHGGRCHDFDTAWAEATSTFTVTENGLVHERVRRDRERAIAEITAKANGARNDIATRPRDANGRLMPKNTPGQHQDTWRSPQGEHQVSPSSASASASASTGHRGKNQNTAAAPRARSPRAVAVRSEVDERNAQNHQATIDAWCKLFLASEGHPYVVTGPDAKHVKELVSRLGPRFSLRDAWERAGTLLATTEVFWLTKRTLTTLATQWNAIPSIPRAEAERNSRAWKSDYDRGLEAIMAAQRADQAKQNQKLNGTHEPQEQNHALSGRTGLQLDGPRGPQRSLPAAQVDAGHDAAAPRPDEDLFGGRGEARRSGPHRIGQGIGVILGAISSGGDGGGAETRF